MALLTPSATADWRQFRGSAAGAAVDASLPARLEAPTNVRWSVALPGRGLSSPIVVGDRVFVTSSSGPRQDRLHVLCFAAADGALVWERQFYATGRTMCHEKTSVAANSPASDGQRIFALFSCSDLVALDLEGNLLWVRALGLDYPNVSNSLGMSSSLVVAEDTVIAQVENDSQSLALGLSTSTGTNRWELDRPKMANWTSPITFRDGAGRSLVGLQSGKGLVAIEPATGKAVWEYTEGASTIPSTAVDGDVLLVPSQGLTALKTDSSGQRQLWRASTLRPGTSSPAVAAGRVYTINGAGVLSCGDVKTGDRLWQLRLKGPFSASPVIAGPLLFVPNEAGVLHVVDTSKPEGEIVSELDLGQTILGTPSIAGNALYVRSDGRLWKIGG